MQSSLTLDLHLDWDLNLDLDLNLDPRRSLNPKKPSITLDNPKPYLPVYSIHIDCIALRPRYTPPRPPSTLMRSLHSGIHPITLFLFLIRPLISFRLALQFRDPGQIAELCDSIPS